MKYITITAIIIGVIAVFYFKKSEPAPVVLEPYAVWCDGEWEYFTPGETVCMSITRDGQKIATTTVTTGLMFFGNLPKKFASTSVIIDDLVENLQVNAVSIKENNETLVYSSIGKIFLPENSDKALINLHSFLQEKKDQIFDYIDTRNGNTIFFKTK